MLNLNLASTAAAKLPIVAPFSATDSGRSVPFLT